MRDLTPKQALARLRNAGILGSIHIQRDYWDFEFETDSWFQDKKSVYLAVGRQKFEGASYRECVEVALKAFKEVSE